MKPSLIATIASSTVIVCNITLNTAIGPDLSVLNYNWYHNNTNITKRNELLEQNEETNVVTTRLNITSVQPSNAGIYHCRASIIDGDGIMTNKTVLCVEGKNNFEIIYYFLFVYQLTISQ